MLVWCMRLNRTPASDVLVKGAVGYLRCHDAPAVALAELRLPQLVWLLRNHPTP